VLDHENALTVAGLLPGGTEVGSFHAETDARLQGVAYTTTEHGPVDSLDEAAALRGVEARAIIKTIVIRRSDDDYVLVLVPGDRVIDWVKLRDTLGERRLSMPDADEALAVTGYVRGTITPFGAQREFPVIADSLIEGTAVSIGGGGHGQSLTLSGDDLVRAVHATVADVTKPK
jgi:Cys-tRNA(Pro)/Cys-tRNA(Cys) deacylase